MARKNKESIFKNSYPYEGMHFAKIKVVTTVRDLMRAKYLKLHCLM
jgi:hypothetical protein